MQKVGFIDKKLLIVHLNFYLYIVYLYMQILYRHYFQKVETRTTHGFSSILGFINGTALYLTHFLLKVFLITS